jgi:flagellar biosynthesis/type III secretory pathway protein FliH
VVAENRRPPNQLENWALWFQRAEELDAAQLRELLPGAPYQKAIGILEMISRTPSQRDVYEARQKAIRDAAWKLHEARKEGLAEGREAGLAEGREEGVRLGQIQLLQHLLNEPLSSASDLEGLTLTELDDRISALQSRLQKN